MLINEVVVIKQDKPKPTSESSSASSQAEEPNDYEYVEEGDDTNPQFLIAFLSGAKVGQDSGDLRIQAINDSNFFMSYITITWYNLLDKYIKPYEKYHYTHFNCCHLCIFCSYGHFTS